METVLNKIIKYSLYLLVFLLPLFFLPGTVFPLALGKQMFFSAFVFFVLILWMIKIIASGKLIFIWNKLTLAVVSLVLVLGISTVFSSSRIQSFWGMSFEPDTFFSFILYTLIFFLFANLVSEDYQHKSAVGQTAGMASRRIIWVFLASSGILALFFLINSFFKILPWDFAKVSGFNPIGSAQALAVFLGGVFVVLIAIGGSTSVKKLTFVVLVILGILLFVSLLLVNFWVVWLGLVFGMAIIVLGKLKYLSSGPSNLLKNFGLPLFILAVALIFIFIRFPLGNILNLPPEINLTHKTTFDISIKTLLEGPKNFILGTGPGTFGYKYSLYRSAVINLTDFWQVRFNQGAAALPTFLATSGILGILAILFMIAVFFWQGFKSLMSVNPQPKSKSMKLPEAGLSQTQLAVFAAGFYFFILWFFYSANFSLFFAGFLMMGLWIASTARQKDIKEFSFSQSPQKAFGIMLVCIALIAGSVAGIYTMGQKYAGALAYSRALNLINAERQDLDNGLKTLGEAMNFDKKDVYFRALSQAYLLKIQGVLANQQLSQEQRQKELQQNISQGETSAQAAAKINPADSSNWFQLGSFYENVILLVEGADQLALQNYQKAAELDPQNPQIPLNIGRVYITAAQKIQQSFLTASQTGKIDEQNLRQLQDLYNQNLERALESFKKSRDLKPNFSPAYYLMAQIYEVQGKTDLALQNYQAVLFLEPGNEEIQKKIEALTK